jgi:hypothetical protein
MQHLRLLATAAVFGVAIAGCSSGTTTPPPSNNQPQPGGSYVQIERLSRPAVKELFEKFVDHQVSNAVEPYNDPTLQGEIASFTDALRPPKNGADYGKTLASVLYPDEYTVDLSQTGGAAYLGKETGGATSATKSTFGGRAVTDDVIDISLGAVFGNTLPTLGLVADDGQENNCLTKQNIAQSTTQVPTGTFPYLAGPH